MEGRKKYNISQESSTSPQRQRQSMERTEKYTKNIIRTASYPAAVLHFYTASIKRIYSGRGVKKAGQGVPGIRQDP